MSLTVAEFAAAQNVSEQRVRELARTGKVSAQKNGRAWVIDEDAGGSRPRRRPLSAQSLRDILTVLADMHFDSVSGVRKQRAAERLRMLRAADRPAALLAEWSGMFPATPETAHQRAILTAAKEGIDDYIKLAIREVQDADLSDPTLLRRRLRDAMQVNQLDREMLADAAGVPLDDVKQLLNDGRLRNFGRTVRILKAAGLRPGVVPR